MFDPAYEYREFKSNCRLVCICFAVSLVTAQDEQEKPEETAGDEAESEPMFGTLDYILLAAILAAGIWWLFFRDSEGDKIPEVIIYSAEAVLWKLIKHL